MNELGIVEAIAEMATGGEAIVLGIGDDCAIYRPKPGEDLLFTTDQFIEGVHFSPGLAASAIGERALARSLSDIAAMGGTPRFCLVSLTVSGRETDEWILAFFRGLLKLARKTGDGAGRRRYGSSRENSLRCDGVRRGAARQGLTTRWRASPAIRYGFPGRLGKPWDRRIQPRLELGRKLAAATRTRAST